MRESLLLCAVVRGVKHNGYFVCGAALGLWLALCVPLEGPSAGSAECARPSQHQQHQPSTAAPSAAPAAPPPRGGPAPPLRALTRPRYYSTELGMRAPLMTAVLTTLEALESRGEALNATLRPLHPAVRLFAPAPPRAPPGGAAPPRPHLVAFTDPRPLLTPFHALKYLADNYLDDYHYFYLVTDNTYVNARRLLELVSALSVSRPLYMGSLSPDSQYCSLQGGVLLSRGVLRAVHAALEWCVRNAYSPQHHENVGRCVLHAAQVSCSSTAQGQQYASVPLSDVSALSRSHAAAVSLYPVTQSQHLYQLHAFVSRVHLERALSAERSLWWSLGGLRRRHPAGYRNVSWPLGLRADPSLAPPPPGSRWDHVRWTPLNATHAYMADDHHSVAPLTAAVKQALQRVWRETVAWCGAGWGAAGDTVRLLEGAYRCMPATGCSYRLLLAYSTPADQRQSVRQVEAVLPLGSARVVSVPYVTESARVRLILSLPAAGALSDSARGALQQYKDSPPQNTELIVVLVACEASCAGARDEVRQYGVQAVLAVDGPAAVPGTAVARAALAAAAKLLPPHALMLHVTQYDTYNDDFLNRVRMNTISGVQWFLPVPFARHALYAHPLFVDGAGRRPTQRTGRFNRHHRDVLSVYNADWAAAVSTCGADQSLSAAALLAACGPRVLSAPDPGLLRHPLPAPAPTAAADTPFEQLDLGAPNDLAKLILQTNAQ